MISFCSRVRFVSTVVGLAALTGCSFSTPVRYESKLLSSPVEPRGAVSLEVVNERESSKGGRTSGIGRLRGGFGNPLPVSASSSAEIENSVRDATHDALRVAGIAVDPSATRALVVRLKTYWLDGFTVFNAWIDVDYELRDRSGNVLWNRAINVKGGQGAFTMMSAEEIARSAFGQALDRLTGTAAEQFASAEFEQHLGERLQASADLAAVPTAELLPRGWAVSSETREAVLSLSLGFCRIGNDDALELLARLGVRKPARPLRLLAGSGIRLVAMARLGLHLHSASVGTGAKSPEDVAVVDFMRAGEHLGRARDLLTIDRFDEQGATSAEGGSALV